MAKNLPAMQETQVQSLNRDDPLEKGPTPVFLPGEFHGQRSLAGYSPWVTKSWTDLLQPGPLTSPITSILRSLIGIANFTNPKPSPPPKSPLKLAHPGVLLIWFMAAPFFQCPGPDLAVIFHTSPPLTPHAYSISESCWIHHQRCPTISHHLHCHHPGPHCKHLPPGLWHWSPSWIVCFCPCPPPYSRLFTEATKAIKSGIRQNLLLVPIPLRERAVLLWQATTPAPSGSPSAPWPRLQLLFPGLLQTHHPRGQTFPLTHRAHSSLRALTSAVCLNGMSAGLPSSLPSDLYLSHFSTLRPSLATYEKLQVIPTTFQFPQPL